MSRIKPTLRQLQVFESVADELSFTRASEKLHLSQPAVSIQVKHLEESVGLPLFEHAGKKISLTEAGWILYRCSQTIRGVLEDAGEQIDELMGIQRGKLDITVATTASYFASRILAGFARRFPQIAISLDVTNREALLRQLELNQCDLVIMGEPPRGKRLKSMPIMENPLVIIASPDHPFASRKKIPVKDLGEQTFVFRESGSGTRAAIMRFFDKKGIPIQITMEMTSNEAIKQTVQAGLGLGIVSLHTVELELETGSLVELDVAHFPLKRFWYLVRRADKQMSPVAQRFASYVLDPDNHRSSPDRQKPGARAGRK
jgi:DNA-binding transcriptional LysR family regulator